MAVKTLQWLYSVYISANTDVDLSTKSPMNSPSEVFPYTVPAGYWLGITDATIQSKLTDRASYFVLSDWFALPSNVGMFSWRTPLIIPEGKVLEAHLINNDFTFAEWMNCSLHGILVPNTTQDYQTAFAFLYP